MSSEEQARVTAIRAEIQRARALVRAERPLDALPVTEEAVAGAQALGWEQLMAEAVLVRAEALDARGDVEATDEAIGRAIELAAVAGDARVETDAWLERMFLVSTRLGRPDETLRLVPAARSAIIRAGSDPLDEAVLLDNIGTAHLSKGQLDEADAAYESAIDRMERSERANAGTMAAVVSNRATVRVMRGDYEGAREQYARSQALLSEELGSGHPSYGLGTANVADTYASEGDYGRAIELYEQAMTVLEEAVGTDGFLTARVRAHLADALFMHGRTADAKRMIERALSDLASLLGRKSPDYAAALDTYARMLAHEGNAVAARAKLDEALAIYDTTIGEAHPTRAAAATSRGRLSLMRGELGMAREDLEAAVEVLERSLGADHPVSAGALADLAEVLLRTGQVSDAKARIDAALAIARSRPVPPGERGRVALVAGWVEAASPGGSLDEANDHGREALRLFAGLPSYPYARLDEATRFLQAPRAYVQAQVLAPTTP